MPVVGVTALAGAVDEEGVAELRQVYDLSHGSVMDRLKRFRKVVVRGKELVEAGGDFNRTPVE